MEATTTTVPQEILSQLGGGKFIAMTGAACFSDGNTLIVKFKGSSQYNIMYITLLPSDLYHVKIGKYRNMELQIKVDLEGVFAEDLRGIFESKTGLRTSL